MNFQIELNLNSFEIYMKARITQLETILQLTNENIIFRV